MISNTSGSGVAIGKDVLSQNTTGHSNTAVGYKALEQNTTGSNNTAMGLSALAANTTNGGNTAIGDTALTVSTTGYYNVAVGFQSGDSVTSAIESAFVGRASGAAVTTGHYNTCLGASSGSAITTGGSNVFVGKDAGDSTTTGGQNICLGQNANNSSSTASNAIVIGHDIAHDSDYFTFGKASNIVYNNFTANNNWTYNSDARLKTDVQDSALGLSFIDSLRPVTFKWKKSQDLDSSDPHMASVYDPDRNRMDSDTIKYGFIAQEVKTAIDDAGASNFPAWDCPSSGIQGVSKEALVVPLVKAIQELSAEIKKLKGEQ